MSARLKLTGDVPTEHWEQVQVIVWADSMAAWKKYPELELLYAIPNGGYELAGDVSRRSAAAAKLRAEGLRPGFPDLCLPVARRGYWALYIEMKSTRKGADTSDEQDRWHDKLIIAGNWAVICYGYKEAIKAIEWYLGYGNS